VEDNFAISVYHSPGDVNLQIEGSGDNSKQAQFSASVLIQNQFNHASYRGFRDSRAV
jgi:hypothetical protein